MEPSTVLRRAPKPSRWWMLATMAMGAAGAAAAVGIAGTGGYDVKPLTVELRAWPAALGKTEMACRNAACPIPGHTEAGTHRAPIGFRLTVTGLASPDLLASDRKVLGSPYALSGWFSENGKAATRAFGIKLGLLSLIGGAVFGAFVSMRRWQRIVGGALAGLLALAVVGLLVYQTYDREEFRKTRFVPDRTESHLPSGVPTSGLLPS